MCCLVHILSNLALDTLIQNVKKHLFSLNFEITCFQNMINCENGDPFLDSEPYYPNLGSQEHLLFIRAYLSGQRAWVIVATE